MAIGGGIGYRIDLARVPFSPREQLPDDLRDLAIAFGETPGRFVCEVAPDCVTRFETALAAVPWAWIGEVSDEPRVAIMGTSGAATRQACADLARSWRREDH
jgi:phosphoribosylformylglycinamidine (FGAM) synthase-like enzyme